jgi:transposase-like protein
LNNNNLIVSEEHIKNAIYNIRGKQVMLDSDLAKLYEVSTSRLNEQVKRNIERFPEDFMFRLTEDEWANLKSQNAISSWGGRRKLPNVFTEQGISTLSGVLNSKTAIRVNIAIMRAFVGMRKFLIANASIFQRIEKIELKQLETDDKIGQIINALEDKSMKPKQGIFFDGQIFDAYKFVSKLIKSATKSIILIDNYVDETVLTLFSKNQKVDVTIYTKNLTNQLKLDLSQYNAQYREIKIKKFNKAHDRFLIIDKNEIYHFGASLKDLGKKWFAFSKFDAESISLLMRKLK